MYGLTQNLDEFTARLDAVLNSPIVPTHKPSGPGMDVWLITDHGWDGDREASRPVSLHADPDEAREAVKAYLADYEDDPDTFKVLYRDNDEGRIDSGTVRYARGSQDEMWVEVTHMKLEVPS